MSLARTMAFGQGKVTNKAGGCLLVSDLFPSFCALRGALEEMRGRWQAR
jgi:hypothetical protein